MGYAWNVISGVVQADAAQYTTRFISSGLLDLGIEVLLALEERGAEAFDDTDRPASQPTQGCLAVMATQPEVKDVIRAKCASALKWLLIKEHEIEYMPALGMTSLASAAVMSANVFGRDDGESQFRFSQHAIDLLYVPALAHPAHASSFLSLCVHRVTRWSDFMRKQGGGKFMKASPATMSALEVTVSDRNKSLLLSNEAFLPYLCVTSAEPATRITALTPGCRVGLTAGLLLDPDFLTTASVCQDRRPAPRP